MAEGSDFGKAWKITASWDPEQGWCVDLVGGWGACSVSSWQDGDGVWLPDAEVHTDQVIVGAVSSAAETVIFKLVDGREIQARTYEVPELGAPFLVYKAAVPDVVPGHLVARASDGREVIHVGFAPA